MWTCWIFRLCCSSICNYPTKSKEPVPRTVITKSWFISYGQSYENILFWLSIIRGTIWNGYSANCDRVLKCTVLYKSVSTVRVHSVDTTTHDSDTMFITVTTLSPVQALVRCPLRVVRLLWALILFSHIRRSYDPLYLLYKKAKQRPIVQLGINTHQI